ncbi:MAG: hypothetical protein GXY55_20995 [Phycisphaerae bacterium]|nr:hypothetical protein [Phycisphaerae bacterium]
MHKTWRQGWGMAVLGCLGLAGGCVPGASSPEMVGGAYRADVQFREFMPLWREGWQWLDDNGEKVRYAYEGMPLGGYLFVYFRNPGDEPLEVKDALLNGVSLARGVAPQGPLPKDPHGKYACSVAFSDLPKDQIDKLLAAGEPVWWKVEPTFIPPGGLAELTVRLRRDPTVDRLRVTIPVGQDRTSQTVLRTGREQPRFFSISFSPGLGCVHAYLRHPSGKGLSPRRILVNGQDLSSRCTIVADEAIDTVAVAIDLEQPLVESTYTIFQADYADGTTALAGLGAWPTDMVYGMWGCHTKGETAEEMARGFLTDMALHNINVFMSHCPGPGSGFVRSAEGQKMLESLGMRQMLEWTAPDRNPVFYFLTDEPDANDFLTTGLDPYKRIGSLGQWLVERVKLFRRHDPKRTPILLNVDNTFKPENWYTYAQLADIACADPYYQEGVQSVWGSDPTNMGAYLKPTYVYAVGEIYQSACGPRPMHLILHTCRFDFAPPEFAYRAPTPEEKRIEVYYALAAGTKQFSYWWYTPDHRYYGVGADAPETRALWKEIGLLGAEVRTVGSLVTEGCPAGLPVKAPRLLWVRSLLAGTDTAIILVVNDNHASDRLGTVVKPLDKARVTVQLPAWLKAQQVFEITSAGTQDIAWSRDGQQVTLDLGTVHLTRMIVVSHDQGLRDRLQQGYDQKFAENVRRLTAAP